MDQIMQQTLELLRDPQNLVVIVAIIFVIICAQKKKQRRSSMRGGAGIFDFLTGNSDKKVYSDTTMIKVRQIIDKAEDDAIDQIRQVVNSEETNVNNPSIDSTYNTPEINADQPMRDSSVTDLDKKRISSLSNEQLNSGVQNKMTPLSASESMEVSSASSPNDAISSMSDADLAARYWQIGRDYNKVDSSYPDPQETKRKLVEEKQSIVRERNNRGITFTR